MHNIEIDKCDEMYDPDCEGGKSIPFHRAGYDRKTGQSPNNPRQQVSTSRSFLLSQNFELEGTSSFIGDSSPLKKIVYVLDKSSH